jgi:hypothetical protein
MLAGHYCIARYCEVYHSRVVNANCIGKRYGAKSVQRVWYMYVNDNNNAGLSKVNKQKSCPAAGLEMQCSSTRAGFSWR